MKRLMVIVTMVLIGTAAVVAQEKIDHVVTGRVISAVGRCCVLIGGANAIVTDVLIQTNKGETVAVTFLGGEVGGQRMEVSHGHKRPTVGQVVTISAKKVGELLMPVGSPTAVQVQQ